MFAAELSSSLNCCATPERAVPNVACFSGRTSPHTPHTCIFSRASRSHKYCSRTIQKIQARAVAAEAPAVPKPGTLPPRVVNVSLGDRSYPIYIGEALLNNSEIIAQHVRGSQILVVTNETIAPLYLDRCSFYNSLSSCCQLLDCT